MERDNSSPVVILSLPEIFEAGPYFEALVAW